MNIPWWWHLVNPKLWVAVILTALLIWNCL